MPNHLVDPPRTTARRACGTTSTAGLESLAPSGAPDQLQPQENTLTTTTAEPRAAAARLGEAAVWYASQMGWRIVQLHHITEQGMCSCGNHDPEHDYKQGGKHPVQKAWQKKATINVSTIASQWKWRPRANVGIATGRESGIFVLDVDPENGGNESLAKLESKYGPLPPTWYDETGSKGGHFFFNYPNFEVGCSNAAFKALGLEGLDLRGDGGQVVAAPSISGKGPYLSTKLPVVDAPAWLLDIIRPKEKPRPAPPQAFRVAPEGVDGYTRRALETECSNITSAPDGDQNNLINIAAFNVGQLVGAGALTENEARHALLGAARAGNHPEGRAVATIESGLRAGMAEPRTPWPPVSNATVATPESIKRGALKSEADVHVHFAEEPDPLGGLELPDPPAMDLDTMVPPPLARFARAVEEHLQVPVEAPVMIGLAVLSTASLGRFVIRHPRSGWTQPPILRTLTMLRSAERKSDVVKKAARPLTVAEHGMWDRFEAAQKAAESARIKLEGERERLRGALKKAPNKGELYAELEGVELALTQLPDPGAQPPQLTVGDATPEALTSALHTNNECIGMIVAEDVLFGQIKGQYSGNVSLGIYLSSYDEETYKINRIGRGVNVLRAPAMAVGMLVQPHIVEEAVKIQGAVDSGLMGRWIYFHPKSRVGTRTIDTPPMDTEVEEEWALLVNQLLALPVRPDTMPVIELGEQAREQLDGFREWIEPLQREITGRYAHMTDWTGKAAGMALRIAGLYHVAEGNGLDDKVSLDTMRRSVNLIRCALHHAEHVHRSRRKTEDQAGVAWIFKWLRSRDSNTFTRRDLTRSTCVRQDWYTPAALDEALAELHRARWIASVADVDSLGREKATGKFIVHPALKEVPRNA